MSHARRTFQTTEVRAASNGVVELSFSSSAPVVVGGVREVLQHDPDAVDLTRLNASAPVLFEHNRETVVGVVERAWIDGVKGRARIRFGTTSLARDIAKDVAAGIRRNVSVGYQILKASVVNGIRTVSRWQPYEISIVSVPADVSVGFGRSKPSTAIRPQSTTMNELKLLNEKRGAITKKIHDLNTRVTEENRAFTDDESELLAVLVEQERTLTASIASMRADLARGARPLTDLTPSASKSSFSHDDIGRYSVVRALRMFCDGRSLDGLEREVHDELQRSMPAAARGLLIPLGLGSRAMTATGGSSGSEGGVTVATNKGEIIDILRPAMTLQNLGATVLTGLTGNLDLPRVNAATNATWKAENAALDASSPTMGQLELRPRRVGTFTEISRQLLIQSSPDIEGWLRADLANAIAGAWEAAAINGSGESNQPRGILNVSGIGDVVGGTHGLAPTWAKIVELESKVADANAAQGSLGYLTNTKVRGKLLTTLRNASATDATFIWPDDGRLRGYNTGVSNHVPSTLTKGDADGVCSAIIFGNFADLVLAQFGPGIDVLVNPYSKDTEGLVRLTAAAYVDVGVRRSASFAAMKDALTT